MEITTITATPIFKPSVKLVNYSKLNPIDLMYCMAKKSVTLNESTFPDSLFEDHDDLIDEVLINGTTFEERAIFVRDLLFEVGHIGVADHPWYSFEVEDINRALSHQAVRNRIAAFLECSLRYVNPITKNGFHYVVPIDIRDNVELAAMYHQDMLHCAATYDKWYKIGRELKLPIGRSKELARTVLPQSTATGYGFTMSCSSLIRLLNKRLCVRAEAAFREVAEMILSLLRDITPEIFNYVGAHCEQYGYCPEGKYSCGKYPTLKELRGNYQGRKQMGSLLDPSIAVLPRPVDFHPV